MARTKDLAGEPLVPEPAPELEPPPGGERIMRTGRRDEDGRKGGDGWVAAGSLALVVCVMLFISLMLFSR